MIRRYRICIDGNGRYMAQVKYFFLLPWMNLQVTARLTYEEAEKAIWLDEWDVKKKRLSPIDKLAAEAHKQTNEALAQFFDAKDKDGMVWQLERGQPYPKGFVPPPPEPPPARHIRDGYETAESKRATEEWTARLRKMP